MEPLRTVDGTPYRAVSFDVDGTLYRPNLRLWLRALLIPGALRGLGLVKRAREKVRHQHFGSMEHLEAEVVRHLGSLGGITEEGARVLLRNVNTRWIPAIVTNAASADARRAVALLRERGVRVAAVSDHATDEKLATLGLGEGAFDVTISAEACGAYKPQPACFTAVATRLGLRPNEILHVGDRSDTDAVGALAAGLGAAVLPPQQPPAGAVQVASLTDLAGRVLAAHPR